MPCSLEPRSLRLPSDAAAAKVARDFLADACCGPHDAQVVEDAQLLVTELVSNAVRHGAPPIELQVACVGEDAMQVRVRDAEPATPRPRAAHPDAEGGRGMLLVDLLSKDWGTERAGDGKAVWFTLTL